MPLQKGCGPKVVRNKGRVTGIEEMAHEAAEERGLISIAEIGRDDPDQVGGLPVERASEIVRSVPKFLRGFRDASPRLLREACRFGDIIQDHRDCRSRQAEVFGQLSQRDSVI